MGLVASQARLLMLFARKSDVEYQAQLVCNRRQLLAAQTAGIANEYANALSNKNPDGSLNTADDDYATAIWEARTAILESQDKALELELRNLDTQQKAISTEIDSVQKVIDKNIEKSFKVFG